MHPLKEWLEINTTCKYCMFHHNGPREVCQGFLRTHCFPFLCLLTSSPATLLSKVYKFWFFFLFSANELKEVANDIIFGNSLKGTGSTILFFNLHLFSLKQHSLWQLSWCLSDVASLRVCKNFVNWLIIDVTSSSTLVNKKYPKRDSCSHLN